MRWIVEPQRKRLLLEVSIADERCCHIESSVRRGYLRVNDEVLGAMLLKANSGVIGNLLDMTIGTRAG
jgi:hypothetical protein